MWTQLCHWYITIHSPHNKHTLHCLVKRISSEYIGINISMLYMICWREKNNITYTVLYQHAFHTHCLKFFAKKLVILHYVIWQPRSTVIHVLWIQLLALWPRTSTSIFPSSHICVKGHHSSHRMLAILHQRCCNLCLHPCLQATKSKSFTSQILFIQHFFFQIHKDTKAW